jgi:hypothetical protein
MKVKDKEVKNLVLVVDDEISTNKLGRQSTIKSLDLPEQQVLFAANYEEALELWENNEIIICYVDYKIPKNAEPYDYEEKNEDWKGWGIAFISYLSSLNHNTSLIVYSSYVDEIYLQKQAKEFKNQITAFYGKPNLKINEYRKQHYLEAVNSLEKREQNLFEYYTLDETTQVFIREKTQNIKILVANTLADMMSIGQHMLEVKGKLGHGQFLSWLALEFGGHFSYPTANRYMSLHEKFNTHDLEKLSEIKISALYNLARLPADFIGEVMDDIQSGNTDVTVEDSKKLLSKYKQQKKLRNSIPGIKITGISENSTVANESQIVKVDATTNSFAQGQILKVIQAQRIWNLDKHSVFALDPNSKEFINKLPQKVSLCLSFPPISNWQCPFDCTTQTIFFSKHDDIENMELLKIVDQAVSISTDRSDIVVVCYIPHPGILSVIHDLECQAIIAEPNRDKCLELVKFHNTRRC